ncbi:erythromycin esterase family protein [Clostridium sp. MB40-C1]|uniref:erythromycin esterase family protein n=1 Tax=Clostridium sp. MB40-C1 TaxID=3070996 RepID=UPI0027E01FC6|nr:erythromycin esterase family protein [Clostridium sp. MB40-C1]WMJ80875.1 erythromycin esterase family protein [Clostridium sp. MB40-C1]
MKTTKLLLKAIPVILSATIFFNPVTVSACTYELSKSDATEIKSLTSTDYKDLEFLKPILKDKTVVSLGENFHRVGEYSSMKTRIIKYLHQYLGFDVIAFESGIGECSAVYEDVNSLTPKQMMENSIFPIWHSKETLSLFNYIKAQSKTQSPLYLAGYDMQPTSGYFSIFMFKLLYKLDKNYAKEYLNFESSYLKDAYSIINKYGLDDSYKHSDELLKVKNKYQPKYEKLLTFVNHNKFKISGFYPKNPHIIDIIKKTIGGRLQLVEMMMLDNINSYEFRDKLMAENVEWITKVLYPGKKVILWAHNDHLAKNTSKILTKEHGKWINSFTSMGELLNSKFKDKGYVLGFYMNSGKATTITTLKPFDIPPMPKGSLENVIIKSGYNCTFVDLSKHKSENSSNSWMFNPIFAAEDGMTSEIISPMSMMFVPKDQYDGVIVINKVSEPTLDY